MIKGEFMKTYNRPAIPIHPGEILKDELDAREWTQKDFARIINRPEKTISAIIRGKKEITPETALEIAAAFGTSPYIWNDMQAKYNLYSAHQAEEEKQLIKRRARLYSLVPIDELIFRGYLKATEKLEVLEAGVCSFLEINSISENFSPSAVFRFGKRVSIDQPSLATWLKIIERKSLMLSSASEFSIDSLKSAIPQIVAKAQAPEKCSMVVDLLLRYGVKLVFEPSFKGTHIDGAVIYINNLPVIGMTMRLDRIDNFWFTLMHELAHVILNHRTNFVDENVNDFESIQLSIDEKKANKWAAHALLPDTDYKKFVTRIKPYFSKKAIISFAETMGVHPGIVVGRLQRDGYVPWKNLRSFLEKIRPYITF